MTSASDGGGMTALINAARSEGSLNVSGGTITTRADLDLMAGFEARYGIRVNVATPGADADQLAAADSLDVFELGVDSAASNTSRFAPYLVFYWLEIPGGLKSSKAYWYSECGHYIAVGYSPSTRPVSALSDLMLHDYRDSIDLPGSSRETSVLAAAVMASLASGGSAQDVRPGVDYFGRLAAEENLVLFVDENPPVLINWSDDMPAGYRTFIPSPAVEAYNVEAINRAARHPAAARLWQEYLFSDQGQNTCIRDGARASRMAAMKSDGVLDVGAAAALEPAPVDTVILTPDEMAAARAYVVANWNSLVGV